MKFRHKNKERGEVSNEAEIICGIDQNNPPKIVLPQLDTRKISNYLRQNLKNHPYKTIEIILSGSKENELIFYSKEFATRLLNIDLTNRDPELVRGIAKKFYSTFIIFGEHNYEVLEHPKIYIYVDTHVFAQKVIPKIIPSQKINKVHRAEFAMSLEHSLNETLLHELTHVINKDYLNYNDPFLYFLISLIRYNHLLIYLKSNEKKKKVLRYWHSKVEKKARKNAKNHKQNYFRFDTKFRYNSDKINSYLQKITYKYSLKMVEKK